MANISVVRMAYLRIYGCLMQDYLYQPQEEEAMDNSMDSPLLGTCSAYPNYMAHFLKKRGIDTVLVRAKNSLAGFENANGTYDGIVGLLQNDEADYFPIPIMTNLANNPVTYSQPVGYAHGVFLQSFLATDDSTPVDFMVQCWDLVACDSFLPTSLLVSTLLIALLLVLCNNPSIRARRKNAMSRYFQHLWTLLRVMLDQVYVACTYCNTAMILYLSYLLMAMFIDWFALNSIGAKMVVSRENIIQSIAGLLDNRHLHLGMWKSSPLYTQMQSNQSHPIIRKVFAEFAHRPDAVCTTNGIETIQLLIKYANMGNTIYLGYNTLMASIALIACKYKEDGVNLRLKHLNGGLLDVPIAVIYNHRIDGTIKRWLNKGLQRVFECGFMDDNMNYLAIRKETDFLLSYERCYDKPDDDNVRQLSLADFSVLLALSAYVLSSSFLVVCLEAVYALPMFRQFEKRIRRLIKRFGKRFRRNANSKAHAHANRLLRNSLKYSD